MANRKITQLQKLDSITTGTQFVAVANNITKRIDLDDLTNAIDEVFFDVHTVDGSANYASRDQDKDGNLYGKFRLVSGNFWVSGSLDQVGVHKGDGSIFKVTTQSIDMRSPERMRLDPTGNLSLGGSLHISGDNNTISGYGMVVRTAAWLQHPLRIDSDVTGAGQWNFTGTAGGKNVKFSAVPTVLAPGGGYDSVALSGKVASDSSKLDSKVDDLAQQIFINSGATNTKKFALESTGIRMNTDRIGILSGSWIVGSGHLQASLDAGCCDNIELVGARLGLGLTGLSGVFHVTGKLLDDRIDVLSGELLGTAAGAAAGLASTGEYTKNNLASLNSFRAHKHTTGVFPATVWSIAQPNYCFACNDNVYLCKTHYEEAAQHRKKFYHLNLNNNMVTGLHAAGTDAHWRYNEQQARRNRLGNLIWVDVRGYAFSKKRTYQLASHYYDQETYQLYLGDTDSSDWGTPERLGSFKRLTEAASPTNTSSNQGGDVESHIIFVANPMTNNAPKLDYPGTEYDVTGSNYCMFEFQDQTIDEDDDPLITGDIFSVHTSRGGSYQHITDMRMYKRRRVCDPANGSSTSERWYGQTVSRGLSGTAAVDYKLNLVDYNYKGRDTFKANFYDDGGGHWGRNGIDLFQYNALKRRFYISFESCGMIHQFSINDGFNGAWSGVNPNDPLRGVNYGGGHLPSWWLAGENRYNHLAYEHSFRPADGGLAQQDGNYHYEWHNGIQFDPKNGDELSYMTCRTQAPWTHKGGFMSYSPLVVPKVGRPIRDDGGPQRQAPFTRAEWTSWHGTS